MIPTSLVDRETDALIEQSRIQRISLFNPPTWAMDQMELIGKMAQLQEIADDNGWEA